MSSKDKIRRKLIEQRRSLPHEGVAACSLAVVERIRALPEWMNARQALLYWPLPDEVDTRPLAVDLWQRGAMVLLPRCRPGHPGVMDLACVNCEDDLTEGSFSIMEPIERCRVLEPDCADFAPDVALIPGVAFDREGYRVGYGGGYYDRLLESAHMGRCYKVGLCCEEFFMRKLPRDDWDRPVNAVCTEERLWQR